MTCILSGLTTGAFYALAPLYFHAEGNDEHASSWIVASAIFGGLVGQWPLGRLSDTVNRRLTILASAAGVAVAAPLIALYSGRARWPGFALRSVFFVSVSPSPIRLLLLAP